MDKQCSLLRIFVNYDVKSFITFAPGPNVLNPFTALILRIFGIKAFAAAKYFQTSLMIVGKAWSLPKSGVPHF
jgi:hypothetical protein